MHIFYSPGDNITGVGLEKLHPFDSRKYGRAWRAIRAISPAQLHGGSAKVTTPISTEDLLRVHTPDYKEGVFASTRMSASRSRPFLTPAN